MQTQGCLPQRYKFMTYLCKSCHFENPENICHKMKRNVLYQYSGNVSNIDQGYARTCPIIDIWNTNPTDRTNFETPSNHLTNKTILISRTVISGVTSLCFWQKWGKWSKSCPVICAAIKNFIWNMMQLKLSRYRWRPQNDNGSTHNDSGILGNYYHWDPIVFVWYKKIRFLNTLNRNVPLL